MIEPSALAVRRGHPRGATSRRQRFGTGRSMVTCWLVLCACAASSVAKVLDSLAVEGISINQPAVVRNSAGLNRGAEIRSADLQDAIRNIYRLGLFKSVDIYSFNETDSSVSVLVKVEEYPICESVEYSGNKKIKQKELEEQVKLIPGRVASDAQLYDNTEALKRFYAGKGYLLVDIQNELIPTKIPGNVIVKITIKEGAKVRIKKITISGNAAVSTKKLKRKFKTKEERWWRSGEYKEEQYRTHLDSLMLYYYDLGFLDARVVHDSVWYAENKKDILVDVQIEEGKKYYAGDFFFTGNRVIASDSLKNRVALRRSKPFQKSKFDLTKYMIEDAYREEGYLWVRLKDDRAYRGDTVDVTFDIAEGPSAVVNKVNIGGNNKTREKVIRREIVLVPGQKYRQSRMARSVRDIYQLNFFDNVTPDLKRNDDGTIDLQFDVSEKDNVGQLSLGAAYSQRDKFVGTFSTSIPNFRGAGQQLDLNVEYGKYRQDFSVGFKEPWAFDYPVSVQGRLFYSWLDDPTYRNRQEKYGFSIGAGRRLKWPDDYFRVDGLYQLSWDRETRRDTTLGRLELPREGTMSRLTLTLRRNDTDMPTFPTRGSSFALTPEIAGLGGVYKYVKTTVAYDYYFPLFWKFVLGAKTNFGIINPFPGQRKIVISRYDVFGAGGVYADGTIRGYPDYKFGGLYDPEDGVTMLTLTSLIQFPVLEQQLYLSVFADMGNTWPSIKDIDPADMYKGVGAGLRIMVPMLGLMGFDFAWRLDDPNSNPADKVRVRDPFEFHFLMQKGF